MAVVTNNQLNVEKWPSWGSRSVECFEKLEQIGKGTYGFCLKPPRDNPMRRSIFDGIIAGCIPIFFEEFSAKRHYGWHLPVTEYDDLSVFIQKEDVVFKGLRIMDVLMRIPRAEVGRKKGEDIEDDAENYVPEAWEFIGFDEEERCI